LTVGAPIRVTNRLLVSVPIQVVCQPIGNPGDITLNDSVSVSLSQANGQSVSTGSAMVSSGPFSPQNPTGTGLFTCDGSTLNTLTVQVLGNGTFHGGGAILTASAFHSTGTRIFQRFCQSTGTNRRRSDRSVCSFEVAANELTVAGSSSVEMKQTSVGLAFGSIPHRVTWVPRDPATPDLSICLTMHWPEPGPRMCARAGNLARIGGAEPPSAIVSRFDVGL
jgi:hypothetical protein